MTKADRGRGGPLRHLTAELAALAQEGRLRVRPDPVDVPGGRAINLCSNDYLGYRSGGRLVAYAERAVAAQPAGAGASRLVCGEHLAHACLEQTLAEWTETEESIVFTSGYAANVGLISALAAEGDLIVSDALNHASIIDGCRLSRAKIAVTPHLDLGAVRNALRGSTGRRRWVITESYFSMDGDSPNLAELRDVCDEWDAALVLDESHAMGVFGPHGRGRAAEAGVRPDVLMGTLGKALGAQGAFVAGSHELCRWLWNRARSFVFSTGLSPLLCEIARAAVVEAQADEGGRARLTEVTARLREALRDRAMTQVNTVGPIVPIILGSEAIALAWSRLLRESNVWVQAIRPPTVPPGTSRLRLTTHADLTDGEIEEAIAALENVGRLMRP